MNILIVDDHVLFSEGLAVLLNARIPESKIHTTSNPIDALNKPELSNYDLCVCDYYMPELNGIEFIRRLQNVESPPSTLLVSSVTETSTIKSALEAGAIGYVDKGSDVDTIVSAINYVAKGRRFIPAQHRFALEALERRPPLKLTRKQRETLDHVAGGLNNRRIAVEMKINETTVKTHVSDLLRIFEAENRTECVAIARKLGVIQ